MEGSVLTLQETLHKLYLHVYDEKGRHVGFDYDTGHVETEIPGSQYVDLDGAIQIVLPPNVTNFYYVINAEHAKAPTENYTLIITYLKNGFIITETKTEKDINQGEKQKFNVIIIPTTKQIDIKEIETEEPWWYGRTLLSIISVVSIAVAFIIVTRIKRKGISR